MPMFKFALAAAISLALMFEPAVAEAKSKSASRTTAVKRVKAKRVDTAKVIAADNRRRTMRRRCTASAR
jgi:hypothetical protein